MGIAARASWRWLGLLAIVVACGAVVSVGCGGGSASTSPDAGWVFQTTADRRSCHAATIAELPSGDLLCAFYAGSAEAAPDVCILTARRPARAGQVGERLPAFPHTGTL